MISLVLQHLESLQLDLTAIDPANHFDAADKVAAMASALRRTSADGPFSEEELFNGHSSRSTQAEARNH